MKIGKEYLINGDIEPTFKGSIARSFQLVEGLKSFQCLDYLTFSFDYYYSPTSSQFLLPNASDM